MDFADLLARYFDPLAFLIVFGGAALVAAARSTREDIAGAIAALPQLFRARPEADALAAVVAVGRIEALAEVRSIACADRVRTAEPFLRRAARRLADVPSAVAFRRWADDELAARRRRHDGVAGFWRTAADAAPAMGMLGTVVGLIQMFATMDDPAKIGPGMALALLTTLYGIVAANTVAGPIAGRLERLSTAELAWQEIALKRLELLAHAELDGSATRVRPLLRTAP